MRETRGSRRETRDNDAVGGSMHHGLSTDSKDTVARSQSDVSPSSAPSPKSKIPIRIKRVGRENPSVWTLCMSPGDTVLDLKRAIVVEQSRLGQNEDDVIPVERQRLIWSGRLLEDDTVVLGSKLLPLSTETPNFIHLAPLPKGAKASQRSPACVVGTARAESRDHASFDLPGLDLRRRIPLLSPTLPGLSLGVLQTSLPTTSPTPFTTSEGHISSVSPSPTGTTQEQLDRARRLGTASLERRRARRRRQHHPYTSASIGTRDSDDRSPRAAVGSQSPQNAAIPDEAVSNTASAGNGATQWAATGTSEPQPQPQSLDPLLASATTLQAQLTEAVQTRVQDQAQQMATELLPIVSTLQRQLEQVVSERSSPTEGVTSARSRLSNILREVDVGGLGRDLSQFCLLLQSLQSPLHNSENNSTSIHSWTGLAAHALPVSLVPPMHTSAATGLLLPWTHTLAAPPPSVLVPPHVPSLLLSRPHTPSQQQMVWTHEHQLTLDQILAETLRGHQLPSPFLAQTHFPTGTWPPSS